MRARATLAVLPALAAVALSLPWGAVRAQEPSEPPPRRPPLPADSVAHEVRALDVTVRRPPVRGKLAGFYRRMERGAGSYVTREEIEERDPFRLTDVVQLVPGFTTARYADGSGRREGRIDRSVTFHELQGCRIQYWLDGMPIPKVTGFDLDDVPPRDVAGIEVYRGASETPARFQRRGSTCGVVVIWTRDPSMP